MNAGTFTQVLAAGRYKANPTAGSGAGEKQEGTASFMDVFAQSLKDARGTGTKAPDKKKDGTTDSKPQETGDAGKNQVPADQGKKSPSLEDGKYRDDSKKAEPGMGNTDKDGDSGKHCNDSGAAEEAMSLQAMMTLMQEMTVPAQAEEAPEAHDAQNAAVQTESIPQTGKHEQLLLSGTDPAGNEQTAALQNREPVPSQYAEAVREQMAREAQASPMDGRETPGRTPDTVRPVPSDIMEGDMAVTVQGHKETPQSGEDMFFGRDSGQDKAFNQLRQQAGTADEEPKDANQALEELKRNADAKGIDLTGKAVQNRMNYGLRPVSDARQQQMDTPVLEQLKTGVERAVETGNRELTIHLKPEGLGDIVVHLTSAGEKMTVRIGVTNPETEKLVTSQMESLKEMLRPLNTEVQEVYHSSQNAMDFSGFSQHMQERQGQQPHSGYSFHGIKGGGSEEELLMEAERMMAESRMSRLYAYI